MNWLDLLMMQLPFQTPLSPDQQGAYQAWKAQNAPKDSGYDYDLPGAFLSGYSRDGKSGHMDDRFKKPWHPTFSNLSQYAVGLDPTMAGSWRGNTYVPPLWNPFQRPLGGQ